MASEVIHGEWVRSFQSDIWNDFNEQGRIYALYCWNIRMNMSCSPLFLSLGKHGGSITQFRRNRRSRPISASCFIDEHDTCPLYQLSVTFCACEIRNDITLPYHRFLLHAGYSGKDPCRTPRISDVMKSRCCLDRALLLRPLSAQPMR